MMDVNGICMSEYTFLLNASIKQSCDNFLIKGVVLDFSIINKLYLLQLAKYYYDICLYAKYNKRNNNIYYTIKRIHTHLEQQKKCSQSYIVLNYKPVVKY